MDALSEFVVNTAFSVPVRVNPRPLSSSLGIRMDQQRLQVCASLSIGNLSEEFSGTFLNIGPNVRIISITTLICVSSSAV